MVQQTIARRQNVGDVVSWCQLIVDRDAENSQSSNALDVRTWRCGQADLPRLPRALMIISLDFEQFSARLFVAAHAWIWAISSNNGPIIALNLTILTTLKTKKNIAILDLYKN